MQHFQNTSWMYKMAALGAMVVSPCAILFVHYLAHKIGFLQGDPTYVTLTILGVLFSLTYVGYEYARTNGHRHSNESSLELQHRLHGPVVKLAWRSALAVLILYASVLPHPYLLVYVTVITLFFLLTILLHFSDTVYQVQRPALGNHLILYTEYESGGLIFTPDRNYRWWPGNKQVRAIPSAIPITTDTGWTVSVQMHCIDGGIMFEALTTRLKQEAESLLAELGSSSPHEYEPDVYDHTSHTITVTGNKHACIRWFKEDVADTGPLATV